MSIDLGPTWRMGGLGDLHEYYVAWSPWQDWPNRETWALYEWLTRDRFWAGASKEIAQKGSKALQAAVLDEIGVAELTRDSETLIEFIYLGSLWRADWEELVNQLKKG